MELRLGLKNTKFSYSFLFYIVYSIILTFVVDAISRNSINGTYNFIQSAPLTFFYNCFLIFISLSIIYLTKRKVFVYYFISLIWIILGVANNIVQAMRGTPLTGTDLKLIKSGLSIAQNYLSKKQLILIFLSILIVIVLSVLLFVFAPKSKTKINYIYSIITICAFLLSLKLVNTVALNKRIISNNFWDLVAAYNENGFIYSFNNTLFHHGISKPLNYSDENVEEILVDINKNDAILTSSNLTSNDEASTVENTNIIMIQLESFFDPTLINGIEFDIDPISNFRNLTKEYSTGKFSVSTIGGGTANTEFESITGLNLDFFAAGEYPYNTVLKSHTTESINYVLKKEGYSTHAIHNHSGDFYGRNNVFKNLGFDTFTPVEYMIVPERTPLGWAKDYPLTKCITDCITSTANQDFIYTITVQGHGNYPDDIKLENKHVNITKCPDELNKKQIEYYANQLYETDQFIKELIDTISKINENSIIAFYGDHLPSLGLSSDMLTTEDMYSTEYVIWNNINLEKKDEDLEAYQLSSKILYDLNITGGNINKLHNEYLYSSNSKMSYTDYQDNLKLIQYDMLFGKGYSYENGQPYAATDMKLGVKPISVNKVYQDGNTIYAEGENFTNHTIFIINNEIYHCTLIDENKIACENPKLKDTNNTVKIAQFIGKLQVTESTEEFTLGEPFSGSLN